MRRLIVLFLLLLVGASAAHAKIDKFGAWVELEFSKEFLKYFEFSVIPEIRFQDDFTVDEYMFDGKLSFEPIKYFNIAASYRINTDVKNKGNEVTNRFAFDANGKVKIQRFQASLRLRLTNYSDKQDLKSKTNYLRPRAKLEYDIKGNKLRPFAAYEVFRDLDDKDFNKSRFDIGATRKLGKYHRVGLYYRLQDYFTHKRSIHILGIDYRFKI